MPEPELQPNVEDIYQHEGVDDLESEKVEDRNEQLFWLINDYADAEEDRIASEAEAGNEGESGQESESYKEKLGNFIKDNWKKGAARFLIGGVIGGATVAAFGVPATAAAASVGAGLLVSSAARGLTELVRRKTEGGKQDEIDETLVETTLKERESKLMRLSMDVRRIESRETVEGIGTEEEAKIRLLNYITEISNPEDENNAQFREAEERMKKHSKKWKWIKAGTSVAAGIIAGGTVAEYMENVITSIAEKTGVHMVGEGLFTSSVEDDYEIIDTAAGHNVREDDLGKLVFDYNDGDIGKIRSILEDNPDLAAMAPFDSGVNATSHVAGEDMREQFNEIISSAINSQKEGMIAGAASTALASEIASNSLFNKQIKSDLYGEVESVGQETESHISDISKNLSERLYRQMSYGAENFPRPGSVVSNNIPVQIPGPDGNIVATIPLGQNFTYQFSSNGNVHIQQSNENGEKVEGTLPYQMTIPDFRAHFVLPNTEVEDYTEPQTKPNAKVYESPAEDNSEEVTPEPEQVDSDTNVAATAEVPPSEETAEGETRAEQSPDQEIQAKIKQAFEPGAVWVAAHKPLGVGKLKNEIPAKYVDTATGEISGGRYLVAARGFRYEIINSDFKLGIVDIESPQVRVKLRIDIENITKILKPKFDEDVEPEQAESIREKTEAYIAEMIEQKSDNDNQSDEAVTEAPSSEARETVNENPEAPEPQSEVKKAFEPGAVWVAKKFLRGDGAVKDQIDAQYVSADGEAFGEGKHLIATKRPEYTITAIDLRNETVDVEISTSKVNMRADLREITRILKPKELSAHAAPEQEESIKTKIDNYIAQMIEQKSDNDNQSDEAVTEAPAPPTQEATKPAQEAEDTEALQEWFSIGELVLPQEDGEGIVIKPGQELKYNQNEKEDGAKDWVNIKIDSIKRGPEDKYEIIFDEGRSNKFSIDEWAKFFASEDFSFN